jgi:hypothetical protein
MKWRLETLKNEHLADVQTLERAFREAMAAAMDPKGGYPVKYMAGKLGYSQGQLYAMIEGKVRIRCGDVLRLLRDLPDDFATEVLRNANLLTDRIGSNESGCHDAAAEAVLEYATEHARWRRVGKLCHRAQAALAPKALNAARWLASVIRPRRKAAA